MNSTVRKALEDTLRFAEECVTADHARVKCLEKELLSAIKRQFEDEAKVADLKEALEADD